MEDTAIEPLSEEDTLKIKRQSEQNELQLRDVKRLSKTQATVESKVQE